MINEPCGIAAKFGTSANILSAEGDPKVTLMSYYYRVDIVNIRIRVIHALKTSSIRKPFSAKIIFKYTYNRKSYCTLINTI